MSLRDRILSADDIGRTTIEVPEWGCELEVRTVTAGERSKMIRSALTDEGTLDTTTLFPMLIIGSCFDPETGEQVFEADDITALQGKSAAAVERVGQKAMEMSGMTSEAVDAEGKVS